MIKEHRFLKRIDELIDSGINQIFLYGKGSKDYFLYDFYMGIRELDDSLKLFFIEKKNFDYFIKINGEIEVFDKELKKVSVETACEINFSTEGFGANFNESNLEDDEKIKNIRDSSQSTRIQNSLRYILETINKKRFLIFLDDFEWQAGIYSNEANLELIKFLEQLKTSKNSVSIIRMNNPLILKENYGFDIDDKSSELFFVSNPTSGEIKKVIRRFAFVNNLEINESELDDIVAFIKSNKKSLRETIRILKNLKKIQKRITLSFFEKVLHSNIPEKVTFDDVVIKDKERIIKIVQTFLKDPSKAQKGIILYGPPGTGKTYIAKAIANEFKMSFFAPTLAEIKGEFVGESAKLIKNLFNEARENEPSIIFLDEIDSIFRKRGGNKTDSYVEDMVNQFLVEIDGINSAKSKVFIVGATNRLEEIDSAIKSRLSEHIKIDLPDKNSREAIISKRFKKFDFLNADFKDEFLEKTEGLSGRDLDNLVKSIKQRGNEEYLTKTDFFRTLKNYEDSLVKIFKDKIGNLEIRSDNLITFDNVVGYRDIIEALKDEVEYVLMDKQKKELQKKFNIKQNRGTLLYGPPGNGKTTFAEAIAGENDFYYIRVVSKDFISSTIEDILKKLEIIFEYTIKLSKITNKKGVVLFFDEIDALIGKESLDPIIRGTLLKYLEDKKGIKSDDSKVILIAATNHFRRLDEASIREGRFDNKFEVKYPTKDEMKEILKTFFNTDDYIINNLDDNYIEALVEYLNILKTNVSVIDIKNLKERIKRFAFKKDYLKEDKILIDKQIVNKFLENIKGVIMDKAKIEMEFQKRLENSDESVAKEALDKKDEILEKIMKSADLEKFYEDVKLFFRMIKDYFDGKCELPVRTVIAIGVALLYVLSPIDVIPDFIPVVGLLDDAFVLTLCLKFIQDDLEEYKKNCIGIVS